MPLGSYIKSLMFAADAPKYRKRRKAPEIDEKALAELLACLGASRIANNLNQLAKAANTGSLYFDDETKRVLNRACNDVQAMRELLLKALGVATNGNGKIIESTSQSFARVAAKPRKPADKIAQPKRFTP
ncbi:MAG: plasmid mobilization relaxosome protein MobC [Rhodobacteraceae bacterium]|nr:plasmid mobilization relaxosome protein MobC [Paracoccaceae bacterium]